METESVDREVKAAGTAEVAAWRDRPTCPGWWVWRTKYNRGCLYRISDIKMLDDLRGGWYGPIPEPPK